MFSSYWLQVVVLLLVSYFPGVGTYLVVPAAVIATPLDYLSVVGWAALGAFSPALTVVLFYDQLIEDSRMEQAINRFTSDRLQKWAKQYGWWFVFFLSPFAGTWVTGVTAKVVQMKGRQVLIVSAISILLFVAGQAALVTFGLGFIPESAIPEWLKDLL